MLLCMPRRDRMAAWCSSRRAHTRVALSRCCASARADPRHPPRSTAALSLNGIITLSNSIHHGIWETDEFSTRSVL